MISVNKMSRFALACLGRRLVEGAYASLRLRRQTPFAEASADPALLGLV